MSVECQILLIPPKEGIYRSGRPVIGTLKFKLNKRTTFNSVVLCLEGKGKCSWSESDGDSTAWYIGEEMYVSSQKNIMSKHQTYIEAGIHEYPFEFFLPDNLPCSFKDPICTIAYKIVARFAKPGLFADKEFDAEIPVYGYLEPCSDQPLIFGLTKNPFSLTSNKRIDLKVEIEKTFVTPGENIHLKCIVNNHTDVPVTGVKTKLVTTITYISKSNHKRTQRKTIEESVVECPGADQNTIGNFAYIVPTLPNLYSIQHSKILIREYKLHVTAKLPFPHRDASVDIPVVIGERKENSEEKNILELH